MRTRAKLALAFVLLLVAAVPALAATTPTGKSADEIREMQYTVEETDLVVNCPVTVF